MKMYDLSLLVVILLGFTVPGYGAVLSEKLPSKQTHFKINEKLKLLNKPSLKTIQTEYGDVIDCVDVYKQPVFDHPSLKNHTLQWKLSDGYNTYSQNPKTRNTQCYSPENYGRKNPYIFHSNRSTISQETNKTHTFNFLDNNGTSNFLNGTSNNLYVNRSTAMLITEGYNYIGAKAEINIWNSYIEKPNEYSTAQIWLISGSREGMESVKVGCTVNPTLYGDTKTRFFIYWTVSIYSTKKLIVQTNHEVVLGSPVESVSSEFVPQYEITIFIFLPGELFVLQKGSAKVVQFGDEVYSETIGKEGARHTSTTMGSGGDARNIIIDYSLTEKYPEWVMEYMDEPYCYSAYNYVQYIKEPEFYFGGHGRHWNPYCR
ncbi:hypothetical protein MKX01_022679 [Papaver californicum]|nr:hypothetical protein MKX01_022679 [Papaver californicum]